MFRNVRPTLVRSLSTKTATVDRKEMDHFDKLAEDWWNETGPVRLLHRMNKIRIPWFTNCLLKSGAVAPQVNEGTPFQKLSILDVGCGGGILTESLSRLGSNLSGLDANDELISLAKFHAEKQNLPNLKYMCTPIEEHAVNNKEKYDVVVCSEIIEHVTEKENFVKSCVSCLKPGGSIFVTTPNTTWLSIFLVIYFLEFVHLIPRGTHESDKFIGVDDMIKMLEKEHCRTMFTEGMVYNPLKQKFDLTTNKKIMWYMLHAIKN